MRRITATLIGWKDLNPNVRHFEFETPEDAGFVFKPGQFLSVIGQEKGREVAHAYSIASPYTGNRFALCVNRACSETAAPYLFTLQPGDEVIISKPLGTFTLRHPQHRLVFIATGTGIAPFRSMLLDHLPAAISPVTLLFGVRDENSVLYREEFEQLANDYPGFRFLPTVTRPGERWHGRTGRVQNYVDEALGAGSSGEIHDVDVYICGSPEMVQEIRAMLEQRGLGRKQIIYESYP